MHVAYNDEAALGCSDLGVQRARKRIACNRRGMPASAQLHQYQRDYFPDLFPEPDLGLKGQVCISAGCKQLARVQL